MAIKFEEPRRDAVDLEDWSKLVYRTTAEGIGLLELLLTNMKTSDSPSVAKGSRFELNGVFYVTKTIENISFPVGVTIASQKWIFVYAKLKQNSEVEFIYGTTMPQFDVERDGWYNGPDRAVAKMFYRLDGASEKFFAKKILKDYESMYEDDIPLTSVPTTGGTKIYSGLDETPFMLAPGAYRYYLKGGKGGKGGRGAKITYGNDHSNLGDMAAEPSTPTEEVSGVFILEEPTLVILFAGLGGSNGGNGVWTGTPGPLLLSGGGSGANGGTSYISVFGKFIKGALGTQGTAGTDGISSYGEGPGDHKSAGMVQRAGRGAPASPFASAAVIVINGHPSVMERNDGQQGEGFSYRYDLPDYSNNYTPGDYEMFYAPGGAAGVGTTTGRGIADLYCLWESIRS